MRRSAFLGRVRKKPEALQGGWAGKRRVRDLNDLFWVTTQELTEMVK